MLRDIDDIYNERRFIVDREGTISYAIDSSEVYNFLHPFGRNHSLDFEFDTISKIDKSVLSDFCVHQLVTDERLHRTITPYHAAESYAFFHDQFLRLAKLDSQNGAGELISTTLEEIERFFVGSDGELHFREGKKSQRIQDSDFVAKIQSIAPTLYLLVSEADAQSTVRRSQVRKFVNLPTNNKIGFEIEQNNECAKYIKRSLDLRRPDKRHQNLHDALALASIIEHNVDSDDPTNLVRLVTRDKAIAYAYDYFVANDGYENFFSTRQPQSIPVVRHPRIFLWLNKSHTLGAKNLKFLSGFKSALEHFTRAADTLVDDDTVNWRSHAHADLEKTFEQRQNAWFKFLRANVLDKSSYMDINNQTLAEKQLSGMKARTIELVRSKVKLESYRQKISKHVSDVTNNLIDTHYQMMFWQSELRVSPVHSEKWSRGDVKNAVKIDCGTPYFPYEFHFRDPFFKFHAKGVAALNSDNPLQEPSLLENFVRKAEGNANVSNGELRLAMSILYAIRQDWEGAQLFSKHAADVQIAKGLPRNEIWYLTSILTRRNAEHLRDFESAENAIDTALKSSNGADEARYLREKAACILERLNFEAATYGQAFDEKTHESSALQILERAIQNYGDDANGRSHCIRIACSYYFDFSFPRDTSEMDFWSKELFDIVYHPSFTFSNYSYRFAEIFVRISRLKGRKNKVTRSAEAFLKTMNLESCPKRDAFIYSKRRYLRSLLARS